MSELACKDMKIGDEECSWRGRFPRAGHPSFRAEFCLPGKDLNFIACVKIGDIIKITATATEEWDDKRTIKLRPTAPNQRGKMLVDGTAVVKKVGP